MAPQGQQLALSMVIADATTTFTVTGPDYSFFAWGFDTTTMMGYSLIVEGLDDNRTVVERNLGGIGDPGTPQANQDIQVVDVSHDAANNLTTLVIERASQTGDPEDPDFTTAMNSLDVIWAYNVFASPDDPNPDLEYHGFQGRGLTTISFSPIPEPGCACLLALGVIGALVGYRPRGR